MNRRQLLVKTSMGTIALFLPGCGFLQSPLPIDQLNFPQAMAFIQDNENIEALGLKYLELFPEENGEQRLARNIISSQGESDDFQTVISNKIQEDFETGAIVQIDGWLLSRTEARQCALFALSKNP